MLGSELVIRTLAQAGVRTIFSLSGNQIMPLYDACIDAGIRIVHVRHEAAAVFMADAWSQITGTLGVALLTAGPGITNGVAPLYSARQSESAVLVISGDSPLGGDGRGPFQEMDQTAVTRPLTKRSERVMRSEDLESALVRAMTLAQSGRPGPVHLALPFDLLTAQAAAQAAPAADVEATSLDVSRIAELLSASERPLLLLGPHGRRCGVDLQQCAQALQAPVLTLESPRGLRDPSLGLFSRSVAETDLVLLVGKALDFTLDFGRTPSLHAQAQVVVIDPDEAMLERARRLLGDRLRVAGRAPTANALRTLMAASGEQPDRAAWRGRVAQACAARGEPAVAPLSGQLAPRELCEAVQAVLNRAAEPILVCDGGEFGQWAQAFCSAPLRIINGTSGAIGGGLCYALAAKIARPEATVIALMGDGTAGFHFAEFDTAAREGAGFIAVIGNDSRWNAEHVIQQREYGADRTYGCTLNPEARYDLAAQGFGAFGARATSVEALAASLQAALASGKPACIDVALNGQPAPVFAASAAGSH